MIKVKSQDNLLKKDNSAATHKLVHTKSRSEHNDDSSNESNIDGFDVEVTSQELDKLLKPNIEFIDLKDDCKHSEKQGANDENTAPSKQSTAAQTQDNNSAQDQEESEDDEEESKNIKITERPSLVAGAPWYKKIIFSWAFPIIKKAST